jgi:hypothetical protein
MDRRVSSGRSAERMPRHSLHYWYIGLEIVKVGLLIVVGVQVLAALGR